jgi:3-hydroxyacyl-CoA dehydrogenase/enoyl-CoA hydratase/3-hydroxybutyryl-CoA epimerase
MTQAATADKAKKNILTLDVRPDGVAVVTIDDPNETLNTITTEFGYEHLGALERIAHDPTIVAGVFVSGKKDSFVVGANINMLRTIKVAEEAEQMASELAAGLKRMRAGSKPMVAAVHGQALGGGFELALACHAIVASDDKKTAVGLPEVQLGLIPAANGLLRIAERAGLATAIDLGLTGRSTRASKAKRAGLVDEVCPQPILLEVACAKAKELATAEKVGKARRKKVALVDIALEKNPIGRRVLFRKARSETRKKTRGHYPATERIVDVLERYASRGFEAAAKLEAKSFGELVVSETAHRLIELFFATTAMKKDSGVDDPRIVADEVSRVEMLGGGLMGGGIAYVTITAGIPVRLKDKDDEGVGRGLKYVRGILDERVNKRQLTPLERDQTFALLTATTDYSGLKTADVVIEAVFEDLALKQTVLRDVEAVANERCIFASNTSSIPITKIAQAAKRPENVVGMHYFSPVHKMPLLEVIRTEKTAPRAVATAVSLGKKQGKTVIVVKDGVGFYTSRILGPYMNEASYLVSEGVPIDAIDQALVDWGWPVGPLTLLDEVGIDVAAHVGPIMHEAFGDRLSPPATMVKLQADDRKGRKNERGFYLYGKNAPRSLPWSRSANKGKKKVDPTIYATLGVEPETKMAPEEIQMRCSLQFVNEALRCFEEGILRSPRDGDIGAIFGLGFPPFRGGPLRYVDTIGADEILRRVRAYEDRFGARWTPAPILVELSKSGRKIYQ